MKLPIYTIVVGIVVSLLFVSGIFAFRPRKSAAPSIIPSARPILSEYQQKRYNQGLFDATDANDFAKVQWCVRAGADVNYLGDETYNPRYPLANAASHQNLEMCRFLLKNGADRDGRNLRYSPLYHAVEEDDLEAVRVLLKIGANPAAAGEPDIAEATISPLDLAAGRGKTDFLKLMLGYMPSLSSAEKQEYFQEADDALLSQAVSSGTLSRIQQLVAKGAEFDSDSSLELRSAIRRRSLPIVNYLLVHGADINKQEPDKETALMEAVEQGSVPILKTLVGHRAKVNLQDDKGRTALMYTGLADLYFDRLMPPSFNELTKELIEQRKRRLTGDATRLLIKYGANVNLSDSFGMTALMYAAQGNGEATETLLSSHAQIKIRDKEGRTALHYAAMARDFRSLRALLRHGARVNSRDKLGATALMLASVQPESPSQVNQRVNRLKCIRLLQRYGANPQLKDRVGDTAKDYSELEDGYDINGC